MQNKKNEYSDLTYSMLPYSWTFCFLDNCPKAGECMRHLSGTMVPDGRTRGYAVFPTALKAAECEHFRPIRKTHLAYGFNNILREVKQKDSAVLRAKMKYFLGSNSSYYRYHHGKNYLSPEQQEWIISLFKSYGYTENLQFDHYLDIYDVRDVL